MTKRLFALILMLASLLALPFAAARAQEAVTDAAATQPVVPPPSPTDASNIWVLDLSTGGRVEVLLRPDKAPLHVARIKQLTGQGFYDGLIFHRVIDGFIAQGGDPTGTGRGGSPLPDLPAEFNDLPHLRGTVSMAHTQEPNTANSQFFIMFMPNFSLDRNYTAFGRVISGMGAVDALAKGEPPARPSWIVRATMKSDNVPPPAAITQGPRVNGVVQPLPGAEPVPAEVPSLIEPLRPVPDTEPSEAEGPQAPR